MKFRIIFLLELRNLAKSSAYCIWEMGEGPAPLPGFDSPKYPLLRGQVYFSILNLDKGRDSPSAALGFRG